MSNQQDQLELIIPLIEASAYKPYRYTPQVGKEKDCNKHWQEKILGNLEKTPAYLVTKTSGEKLDGFVLINDLAWDSNIFNKRMAALTEFVVRQESGVITRIADELLQQAVAKARKEQYEFLMCKVYTDDLISIHALEKAGFLLVDTLLDYSVDFRKVEFQKIPVPEVAQGVKIRFAEKRDADELADLARLAFTNHFGRYHSDPRISRKDATQTYVEWMNSSLNGYADYFVLAEIDKHIAGLSIWKKTSALEKNLPIRLGHYSIGAIHPDFFGRKLFSILTYEGMKLLQPEVDMIEGPTHINNYAVQRGYARLGWQISDARHSFHKWLD
jgi:ribosomal protein S18 acetylase RimI-like enzyme